MYFEVCLASELDAEANWLHFGTASLECYGTWFRNFHNVLQMLLRPIAQNWATGLI